MFYNISIGALSNTNFFIPILSKAIEIKVSPFEFEIDTMVPIPNLLCLTFLPTVASLLMLSCYLNYYLA